jgi:hypothetical protein
MNMIRFQLLGTALLLAGPVAAQVGTQHCFGNGCPCGNDDPSAGCGNFGFDGDVSTGATLSGAGSADVWFDDLTLTVDGIRTGDFGLIFMGDLVAPTPGGDGLRCVGAGPNGLWRFPVAQADSAGSFSLTKVISQSEVFGGTGVIQAGQTWNFQAWSRDPSGPCGNGTNFSNALSVTFEAPGLNRPIEADFAGRSLAVYPFFERVRAINQGADLSVALEATRFPWLVGVTGDLYVVANKSQADWDADPSLVDARAGGAQAWTLVASGMQTNTLLADGGTLNGTFGIQVGVGYDVVFDVDQDGQLGPGDVVDGLGDAGGVYVVRDTNAPGPHAVTEVLHNGGAWLLEDIYYPSDIANLGELPLLVISHGNGHNYTWYDHIGFHMASYGWVVMSHSNETGPGIETASETTLQNTDYFLGNLATIAGGVLDGHVDGDTIAWLGHSRGAEGVVRAYDRLFDADFVPVNYSIEDIKAIDSMLPTVFFNKAKSNPHKVKYHLWVASADADVWGAPNQGSQLFSLFERAKGEKAVTVVQGSGHAPFHAGGGNWVADGPCQVGPVRVHRILRGYLLPLLSYYVFDDVPSKDFLWRQYETFQPIGAPVNGDGCVVVSLEYDKGPLGRFVIDNFEAEPSTSVSSSGQAVTFDVTDLAEGRLQDANTGLEWNPADPFNGMTRAGFSNESPQGIVFSWDQPSFLEFAIDPAQRNWTNDTVLSFRACQQSRHPNTTAVLGDLTFGVTLRDSNGASSTIDIGAFGAGIEEPYQRTGLGAGAGWTNEFETIRLRLTDFLVDGSGLNLALIEAVRFEFGTPASPEGRLGFDSLELLRKE